MSPVRATCRRTIGVARSLFATPLAICGFLALAAALFAFRLNAADGGRLSLAAIWTASVSPVLPALAALLAMDVWSDERRSGRMDLLLSAAVCERDLVLGKFLGVYVQTMLSVVFFLLESLALLTFFSSAVVDGARLLEFIPGLLALSIQGALWCAVSVAASACFRHAAAAAFVSVLLTAGIPRGAWAALQAWAPQGRWAFGEMPLDAHAFDFACGILSTGVFLSYLILIVFSLFLCSKTVSFSRLVGRGAASLRWSTGFVMALSAVVSVLAVVLVVRLDTVLELPTGNEGKALSARMRNLLSVSGGEISVTCFLPRSDSRFRSVSHFLRTLKRVSSSVGGARFELRFVDPRWDLGAAERLVRLGAPESSVVFEKGGRTAMLPLSEGFNERLCYSTIQRVSMPPQRRNVYWTFGHGESSFESYSPLGMSDIARELARAGYRNARIDLAGDAQFPADCALVVVAGAKEDFSRAELGRIDSYLKQGGRLLVLANSAEQGGVATLLPSWGIRPSLQAFPGARTLSGSDVIVSDFTEHAIVERLRGAQIVLERPVAFAPSAVAEGGAGADRIEFSSVAKIGPTAVAAVVERGAGAGSDLAIRPTRIVAVGDASFVMNGQLTSRANANRDFFLNCVAYLSGTDASAASGTDAQVLDIGMDRACRGRFVLVSTLAVPAAVFLVLFVAVVRRRVWR